MIIQGHVLTELRKLSDESVDLCLTGPPFYRCEDWGNEPQIWDIYTHQKDCNEHDFFVAGPMTMIVNQSAVAHYGQRVYHVGDGKFCSKCDVWYGNLGLEPTIDLYVSHMTAVFNEVKRVLKDSGSCWIVMGDTYDYPGQSLLMIPERLATAMVDDEWILRSKIISNNQRCLTSSATQRSMTSYWTVYFFTKTQYHPHPKYYSPLAHDNEELNGLNLIRFHCPAEDGIVLDPFCGNGRVALAAALTKRCFIGIELNKERARYAEERVMTMI